ncbi:hypothetical protein AB4Y78_04850 [Janibacter sp. RAF52]|uniref:hypothetical protein n=1 Tax=unclassified Janibacter TaxID=2649294 RepID=UPI003F911A6D
MDEQTKSRPRPVDGEVRAGSQDILDQARWLYGIHADRSNSAQQRATAVMAFAGAVLAITSSAMPESPGWLQSIAFLITLALAVASVGLAISSLAPRATEGPSVNDLREQWRQHRKSDGPVEHVHQITESLLRTTADEEPSFLDHAREEANRRMTRLKWAYWALGSSLVALSVLSALTAFHP